MAFMGVLGVGLFLFAILATVFVSLFFMGICLLIIGITGVKMNKVYKEQTKSNRGVANPLYNTTSIILGISGILFILSYIIYLFVFAS